MAVKTATVIGATGLIGSHLVALLQRENEVERIKAVVRRPVQFRESKVEMKLVNFDDPESFKLALEESDTVFCAVGTTQKKVRGDKEAYRKIDYGIPVTAARFCAETGCGVLLLVSSVGANKDSNTFYLKLKGEVEDAVQSFALGSVSVFRPSILLGNRNENRPGEKVWQAMMQGFRFLMLGPLRKFKGIAADDVARAMIAAAKKAVPGFTVYEYDGIKALL